MTVRLARSRDAEAVAHLKVRAWLSAYEGLLPERELTALDPERETLDWSEHLAAPRVGERLWLAVDDDSLAGFARTGPAHDPDLRAGSGEVHGLYVAPDRIGSGVGTLLLGHALADFAARGFTAVVLWQFAGNERAASFYDRAGLVPDGALRASDFGVDELRRRIDLE
ncbi:MAG: GNAT family N-acetyltransferase [Gaiellaceae bacterium]